MGGSSSKPSPSPVVQAPVFDATKLTAQLPDIEAYEDQVKATIDSLGAQLQSTWSSMSTYQYMFWMVFYILIFSAVVYICYYYLYPWILSRWPTSVQPSSAGESKNLSITSATVGNTLQNIKRDVKEQLIGKIDTTKHELHVTIDDSIGVKRGESLTVNYEYTGEVPSSVTVGYGKTLDIVPSLKSGGPSASSKPSSWWNNTNLLTAPKDAKEMSTISVPINGDGGAYGYQFWMYVADWNYKFGQDKHIMSREDSTNTAIMNPMISLHPTDNTMKISVSIFPTSGDSSKAEPAPAGHSGATDDVFVCEIPNIPLQTWLAVSVTVSTRNLDVYLNGKLVKSCFLTGVPKPVSGSVSLNKGGGFSGWMCSFYHYAKLLVPTDAQTFFSSGVPCNVPGTSTNYKVTLGVHDTKGQVVSKYMF